MVTRRWLFTDDVPRQFDGIFKIVFSFCFFLCQSLILVADWIVGSRAILKCSLRWAPLLGRPSAMPRRCSISIPSAFFLARMSLFLIGLCWLDSRTFSVSCSFSSWAFPPENQAASAQKPWNRVRNRTRPSVADRHSLFLVSLSYWRMCIFLLSLWLFQAFQQLQQNIPYHALFSKIQIEWWEGFIDGFYAEIWDAPSGPAPSRAQRTFHWQSTRFGAVWFACVSEFLAEWKGDMTELGSWMAICKSDAFSISPHLSLTLFLSPFLEKLHSRRQKSTLPLFGRIVSTLLAAFFGYLFWISFLKGFRWNNWIEQLNEFWPRSVMRSQSGAFVSDESHFGPIKWHFSLPFQSFDWVLESFP